MGLRRARSCISVEICEWMGSASYFLFFLPQPLPKVLPMIECVQRPILIFFLPQP